MAHLLRETDGLLVAWLEHLGLVDGEDVVDFEITTQMVYEEGRPDVQIELFGNDREDLIFVESKLGSQEGPDQLRRYARELAKKDQKRARTLLFITRDYEPKDEQAILQDVPAGSVRFRQLRWSDFYQFLSSRRDDRLIDEVCSFMEENRMAQSNQFSPSDILAMSRLPQVLSLMNETLFGEVADRFEEVVGQAASEKMTRGQLDHNRYTLYGPIFEGGGCGLGYWFDGSDQPKVGVFLHLDRNSPAEGAILAMIRKLDGESAWTGYRLNRPRDWPSIELEKPLDELVEEEDHVAAVKAYFLKLLDEVVEVKRRYPEIPWRESG